MADTSSHPPSHRQAGTASPAFTLLVSLSTLLVFLVILLSAYLRLVNSGLGCDDWPACYAQLIVANGAPASAHGGATLAHRLTASTLGVFILAIAVIALQRRHHPDQNVGLPLTLLGLTVFLALLGYKTPAQLLPWVTLGNLLGGMSMLALLWWLGMRPATVPGAAYQHLRPWAIIGLILICLQIALGAWTSANFAALACTSLMECGDAHGSAAGIGEAFAVTRQLVAGADGHVVIDASASLIHLTHRLGAVITFVYLGWLGRRTLAAGAGVRNIGVVLLCLLLLQVTLGVSAVAFSLPLMLVLMHNATAGLLLLCLVTLNRRLSARLSI